MSEEFDKRLKDHITDVFDNYEGSSADAGWALLRQKYPKKDKRRPIAWWWFGMAAGLLLIGSAAFWLYRSNNAGQAKLPKTMATTKPAHRDTVSAPKSAGNLQGAVPSKVGGDQATAKTTAPASVGPELTKTQPASPAKAITNSRYLAESVERGRHNKNPNNVASNATSRQGTDKTDAMQPDPTQSTSLVQADAVRPTGTKSIESTASVEPNKPESIQSTNGAISDSIQTIASSKPNPTPSNPTKPNPTPSTNAPIGKKVIWSAFVAGYDVLSNSGDASYNMGTGFSTDFKLTRVVWVSTGLGLYKNTFAYSPTAGGLYYSPPVSGSSSGIVINYTADLWALELPFRLSFQISKSGNYLSTGLSSAFYVSETYRQSYTYSSASGFSTTTPGGSPSSGGTVLPADVVSQTYFSTFAFAKTFDLVAGFGYALGKNRLVLEPFIKIPVNSVNHGYFRYGAIGAALKFSFGAGIK